MLFKFILISDESEKFLREITIDADATFLDLNKAILDSCGYKDDQITSFYTCDDDWEQKDQITREDMGTTAADQDIYIMEKTPLSEFIHDEGQKLVFVFDPFNDRVFYMKVDEIITGKSLREPVCTRSEGKAPKQINDIDGTIAGTTAADNVQLDDDDDEFYGSDNFDDEDFDPEGFEIEEH
jgi:hypothetical protein